MCSLCQGAAEFVRVYFANVEKMCWCCSASREGEKRICWQHGTLTLLPVRRVESTGVEVTVLVGLECRVAGMGMVRGGWWDTLRWGIRASFVEQCLIRAALAFPEFVPPLRSPPAHSDLFSLVGCGTNGIGAAVGAKRPLLWIKSRVLPQRAALRVGLFQPLTPAHRCLLNCLFSA